MNTSCTCEGNEICDRCAVRVVTPAEPAPAPPKMDLATQKRVLVNAHALAQAAADTAYKMAFALNAPDGTEADQLEAAALDLCDAMAKLEEVAAELKKS
jgi:hypothetical protein